MGSKGTKKKDKSKKRKDGGAHDPQPHPQGHQVKKKKSKSGKHKKSKTKNKGGRHHKGAPPTAQIDHTTHPYPGPNPTPAAQMVHRGRKERKSLGGAALHPQQKPASGKSEQGPPFVGGRPMVRPTHLGSAEATDKLAPPLDSSLSSTTMTGTTVMAASGPPPPQPKGPMATPLPGWDPDKTEKSKSRSARSSNTSKISKLLSTKWKDIEEEHKSNAGKLPPACSRVAFDRCLRLNRFEDVVCVDQTRVQLSDPSLYLHASWVNIAQGKKAIIGQLPIPACALAFWSMVAENGVQGILVLLDENESYSFESDAIFPSTKKTLNIGPRTVVTDTHHLVIDPVWTLHVVLLVHGDTRKYVHVHHYTGWAGDGVPKMEAIWQMQSVFRKYSGPHVYMSLAGVGRAATFAAIQMAHEKLHDPDTKSVEASGCIATLREQRMHAVQSLEHAASVHAALVQHVVDNPKFEKESTSGRVTRFVERFKKAGTLLADQ